MLTKGVFGCIIVFRRCHMALFIVRLMAVLTLAISVGACAGKRVVSEVPEQPSPEVLEKEPVDARSIVPNFETTEEHQARQKRIAEAEEEQRRDTLERHIKETRETASQRKERLERLKESELEGIVFKPTFEERQILARAQEIEVEEARKKAQDAKEVGDTPAIRQARREDARLKRQQEREAKVTTEAIRDARLTGCADPDSVGIFALDQRRDPFAIFPSTLRIRILNQGSNPINVETSFRGYGQLVGNLCGGGSINVTFKLNSWEPGQQVPLTITTKLPNGRMVSEMRYFWLQKSYQQQFVWNDSWVVNLDNR